MATRMPGETHRQPLTTWPREVVRATVLAYRAALAEGKLGAEAERAGMDAYVGAGGDPGRAAIDIFPIVSATARDHGEWFWRPVRERVERKEQHLRSSGLWPPPKGRRDWLPRRDG